MIPAPVSAMPKLWLERGIKTKIVPEPVVKKRGAVRPAKIVGLKHPREWQDPRPL